MDWIPVEEKLPELRVSISNGFSWESERVLVCGPDYGTTIAAFYANEGKGRFWWWDKRHGTEQTGITLWMPLPQYRDTTKLSYCPCHLPEVHGHLQKNCPDYVEVK